MTLGPPPAPSPAPETAEGPLRGLTLCLDAGHGGYDGGAFGRDSGTPEKSLNLDVALRLQALLEQRGARVVMTRTEDVALAEEGPQRKRRDLQLRVDRAQGADAFLSIHMNEYRARSQAGPQVFYRAGQEQSRLLAGAVQAALIRELRPARERSALAGDYFILSLDLPSVLVECGFLSNPDEEALLLTNAYQEQIARAIRDGIAEYLLLSQGQIRPVQGTA